MAQETPSEMAARRDPLYERIHESPEFVELRRRHRRFVLPATIAFLSWYLLYVVMSNWATGFMKTEVIGNVNAGLVFGLLQFVTTFLLAYLYSRYSIARLDPLAAQLNDEYEEGMTR